MSLIDRWRSRGPRCRPTAVALAVTALLATSAAPLPAAAVIAVPSLTPIEDHYERPGPWEVAGIDLVDPVAGVFHVVHPRELGRGGFRHPILTWGNGTNATPAHYHGLLRHLATWGFVVIGSDDGTQADGASMLDALRAVIAADADPHSIFFGNLDTGAVGALGHSQGAGGAINAANGAGGLIDTAVSINLPDPRHVGSAGSFRVADLRAPTLLLGASNDQLISSAAGLRGYYEQVPRAAMAVLIGAHHLSVQWAGSGYLGYLTAWMMWQLRGDRYAAGAATGTRPELARHPGWLEHRAKGLL